MILYRLTKKKYCKDLSGKGAEIAGGRWNSIGNAVLYTSANRALCTAEVAVHIPFGIIPVNYFLMTLEIPANSQLKKINPEKLSKNWKAFPHISSTKRIGDEFIFENKNLVLKVPSSVIQGEYNYLLNPNHKDFKKVKVIKIEPFEFDTRLFER